MRSTPLFSSYRQGENRVTASMLAVFERIDLGLVQSILASATGESSLQMVTFTNQPSTGAGTVPDARIAGAFSYWFEVKTQTDALAASQLTGHLSHLMQTANDERLIVLTPDAVEPAPIAEVKDPRVFWINFRDLSDAIDAVLEEEGELAGERARLLLRELQALFAEERLLETADTVIVAARVAYDEYLQHHAYVCQPGRSFRPGLTHMGFYKKGEIRPELPRIIGDEDGVMFTPGEAKQRSTSKDPTQQRIGETIATLLGIGRRTEGQSYRVFILSSPESSETVILPGPIVNATTSKSGKPWAWTLGQRYTSLAALTKPGMTTTDDLE